MSFQSIADVKFNEVGLVPAIVQHAGSLKTLMLGYMNQEALQRTLDSGLVWFYSRSRQRLWQKGETSDNVLRVQRVMLDCDGDTILVHAQPAGPTCHTGEPSCFFNSLQEKGEARAWAETADELFETILQRLREKPEGSYVNRLVDRGHDRVIQKVGEEATEVVIAAKNDDREALIGELADLWFHSYILLADKGLTPADVWAELNRRRR